MGRRGTSSFTSELQGRCRRLKLHQGQWQGWVTERLVTQAGTARTCLVILLLGLGEVRRSITDPLINSPCCDPLQNKT